MYAGSGFVKSELGDVDIISHDGLFHLFHLVLPNHDYIAHAVSRDGFLWRRVKNPLFIGEPGEWDDDMLWTMHVSPDPDGVSRFRMFYTGICRKEGGRIQRIGLARSDDLYQWEKTAAPSYPLSIAGPHYEESEDQGRHWVSCRDPFFYYEGDDRLLLVNARVASGPVIRRGCIGLAREVRPDHFVWEKPLFYPGMYDDIEVPGLYRIQGRYYLLGNIKEDIKVHYWHSESLSGPYESFADNVLLPKGNYAGRITRTDEEYLVWNFFYNRDDSVRSTILPPPTELAVDEEGRLFLRSYSRFDTLVREKHNAHALLPRENLLANPTAKSEGTDGGILLSTLSGYELFFLPRESRDFRLSFRLTLRGRGKCGIVFRSDNEGNAQYIGLDFINGLAQGRVWGENDGGDREHSFIYRAVQTGTFKCSGSPSHNPSCEISAVVYGGYIELSVNGKIILRYVETGYINQDRIGIFVESAEIFLENLLLEELDGPEEEDHHVL